MVNLLEAHKVIQSFLYKLYNVEACRSLDMSKWQRQQLPNNFPTTSTIFLEARIIPYPKVIKCPSCKSQDSDSKVCRWWSWQRHTCFPGPGAPGGIKAMESMESHDANREPSTDQALEIPKSPILNLSCGVPGTSVHCLSLFTTPLRMLTCSFLIGLLDMFHMCAHTRQ